MYSCLNAAKTVNFKVGQKDLVMLMVTVSVSTLQTKKGLVE